MGKKNWIMSAPITINFELTDGCNVRCRHCYNFWRQDKNKKIKKITKETFDRFLEMLVDSSVFHVVLTGGEPFINFDVLEYGLKALTDNGISNSVNSNLMLADENKIKRLKDAGLNHILTSLNSYIPETNDYMTHQKGSFERIINGIKITHKQGVRISVNMIISQPNKHHVYQTGALISALGCQTLFATRTVPNVKIDKPLQTDFRIDISDAKIALEQLYRVNQDFKIGIGTLVSYPLCLLGDLEAYKAFVGRGCPAQTGNRMNINSDGTAHACVHEEKGYGNIFEIGIKNAFAKMRKWHDGSYVYKGCSECDYVNICMSGCRMSAKAYNGSVESMDHLMPEIGSQCIVKPYKLPINEAMIESVDRKNSFVVPERIRFREEKDFYIINVRWANAFPIKTDIAQLLIKFQREKKPFNIDNFGIENRETMLRLLMKDAIESYDGQMLCNKESKIAGASINPFAI